MTNESDVDFAVGTVRPPSTGPSRLENWEIFFPPGIRVVALPSWSHPRLLVPMTTLVERASASGFYPAFRIRGRLFHWMLRVKAVLAVGARTSTAAPPVVSEFLEDVLPKARVRAVQVGMKGHARKCILQLADDSGMVVGYVKCAESPLARQRLRDEFHLLGKLPPGAGPIPLKLGSVGNYDALLLDVVPGKALRPIVPPPHKVREFTRALLQPDFYTFESHPWVQAHSDRSDEMRRFFEALSRRTWPVAIQHGDFAPWNLIEGADGGLTAIDWEYGDYSGFPGLDLAQYVLQVAGLIRRWSPTQAREYVISQLMGDEHLHLTRGEAAALVGISAYRSYQNTAIEGHLPTDWAQVWRRAVWEEAI
jgi:Phosphotransferase enzyme family